MDDLHADTEDGLGPRSHRDVDGLGEIGGEAKGVALGCHLQRLRRILTLDKSSDIDHSRDLVDVDADLFDFGVGVDVLVDLHLIGVHFLLQRTALAEVEDFVVV